MAGCRSFASSLASGCRNSFVSPNGFLYKSFTSYRAADPLRSSSRSSSSSRKCLSMPSPFGVCCRGVSEGSCCTVFANELRPPGLLQSAVDCSSFVFSRQHNGCTSAFQLRAFSSGMRNTKAGVFLFVWANAQVYGDDEEGKATAMNASHHYSNNINAQTLQRIHDSLGDISYSFLKAKNKVGNRTRHVDKSAY